jgi:two-component system chemotaxis response regulator CheY
MVMGAAAIDRYGSQNDREVAPAHIICVDDEDGILNALRQQLSHLTDQYEVDVATSGQEALDLIADLEADGEPVAMVIADQIMPGMKGVELLELVHRRHPRSIKILLTGQAGLDAVVQAINRAGLNRYIAKPWDEPDLRITVDNLLTKYRLEQENLRLIDDLKAKNEELSKLNRELEKTRRSAHGGAGSGKRAARQARDHRRPDRHVQSPLFSRAARAGGRA